MSIGNLWITLLLAEKVKRARRAVAYLLAGLPSETNHSPWVPAGFSGNMCQQPLMTVFFITPLAFTGISGRTEPASPMGLLLLTLFNTTFRVKIFSSCPWWLQLGGSAGIFAERGGTGWFTATTLLLRSSGRDQHETLSLQTAPEGRRSRSCSQLALEQLPSAQEPSLGSAS